MVCREEERTSDARDDERTRKGSMTEVEPAKKNMYSCYDQP